MTLPADNASAATMPVTSLVTANTTAFEYVRPFDQVGIIVTATIIFIFLVIGVVGNILTILVIRSNAKLKNIFMHFILSLCVSDLISALISWLFLYRRTWGFDNWYPMPDFLCRFYWAADLMTNYVTALHILSFAILRYISIQFPIRFSKIRFVHGKIWIAAIWTTCFVFGFIPFSIFFGAKVRDRSSGRPEARFPSCTINLVEEYKLYQKICFPLFLYVPTFGVVILCVLIGAIVRRRSGNGSSERQTRKEKQAVMQLVLIVISFLIGYIPFTAYEFWSIEDYPNTQYYASFDYWFGMTEYLFLRFSECLNPIFYNLGSTKMRKCTKRFLAKHLKYPIASASQADVTTTASRPTADFGV